MSAFAPPAPGLDAGFSQTRLCLDGRLAFEPDDTDRGHPGGAEAGLQRGSLRLDDEVAVHGAGREPLAAGNVPFIQGGEAYGGMVLAELAVRGEHPGLAHALEAEVGAGMDGIDQG